MHEIHEHNEKLSRKHKHPRVQQAAYCSRAVDRLRAGPANIPCVIEAGNPWVDTDFQGTDTVWWSDFNAANTYSSFQSNINAGTYYFDNWDNKYPNADVLDNDGTISYTESLQGSAGTCYMMASLASIGEFPSMVRNTYVTQTKNTAGILAVNFYIRGKPWTISIDE